MSFILESMNVLYQVLASCLPQQSFVSIDVETLLCSQAFRACQALKVSGREHVLVRQNVALGLDIFAAGVFEYRRVIWLSGMIRHEGIPGFDRLAIQQNSQSRPGAFRVSVKHHSQVLFDFVDQIEKSCTVVPGVTMRSSSSQRTRVPVALVRRSRNPSEPGWGPSSKCQPSSALLAGGSRDPSGGSVGHRGHVWQRSSFGTEKGRSL